ncbi:MAG: hypothetical protein ACLQL2_08435 [Methylovirgula sp.]
MANPAATGAKNCPKSAIKKTGAIHSSLRRKSFFPSRQHWGAGLRRSSAPANDRAQRASRRESVTRASTHLLGEWQKQNNHRLLKNKEISSASLATPSRAPEKSGTNLANLLCGMRRKSLAASARSEAFRWSTPRR